MVARSSLFATVLMLLACPGLLLGQPTAGEGRTLERRGRYEDAAAVYRTVLENDRACVAAWLGLERSLEEVDRLESLTPALDSALEALPADGFLHELQLRVWMKLGLPDSVTAAARRWIRLVPNSPNPYREWAHILSREGNTNGAHAVLEEARAKLGATVLAPEKAALFAAEGFWVDAAREWSNAVIDSRTKLADASLALGQVGEPDREGVLRVLLADDAEAIQKRLGAELLVVWGRPDEGWALLESALSVSRAEAATELQLFADRLRRIQTKESARIRAYANERLASYVDGEETERARLDAAQAYADAGDLASARRMLEGISDLNDGSFANVGAGVATLIRVTAESGRVDEAEERLEEWESQLRPSEAQRLRETIGWAWVLSGEFDRATEILGSDSTVSAYAIIGWASLYAGNLRVAKEHFLVAGPFAQSREQATRRTSMLALLQGVEPDTVPALGEALLWLERADTTKALDELELVARELPDSGGRSPVLTLAGGIAREIGDLERAESLLVDALNADSTGASAASAEYALGLVLADGDRGEAAAERLEHMILTHPGSALVPEARRLLDQVRGAIPDDD